MSLVSQLVEGCAYNAQAHLAAFNLRGMPVVINANEITIYGLEDRGRAEKLWNG